MLTAAEITGLVELVAAHHTVAADAEITLEANPDDLDEAWVAALRGTPVNRLSVGIQSFFEEDLRWMNRAHNAVDAEAALKRVQDAGFSNITADLIYGYPLLSDAKWKQNIARMLAFGIPHISAYSMTIEPQTALAALIRKGRQQPMDEQQSSTQFIYLMDALEGAGYQHYEISNFALPGHHARHNSNYWKGVPYLGIGPSAHSFNGDTRQWNVSNNAHYLRALSQGGVFSESETLSVRDKLNEYLMTSLRTVWGLDLDAIAATFGQSYAQAAGEALQPFVRSGNVEVCGGVARLTRSGKLLADHITSELFFTD